MIQGEKVLSTCYIPNKSDCILSGAGAKPTYIFEVKDASIQSAFRMALFYCHGTSLMSHLITSAHEACYATTGTRVTLSAL